VAITDVLEVVNLSYEISSPFVVEFFITSYGSGTALNEPGKARLIHHAPVGKAFVCRLADRSAVLLGWLWTIAGNVGGVVGVL